MARRNAYKRIAEQICGSRSAWRGLPDYERQEVLDTARQMYDLGVDFASAENAEKTEKRGFVYIITNQAWPGYVKIGRAFNPEARLRGYQTSCPMRDYELTFAAYFRDCHKAETFIHNWLAEYRAEGEWFRLLPQVAEQVIYDLRERNYVG